MTFIDNQDERRKLESQLQQRECQLFNVEGLLKKTKNELEGMKSQKDHFETLYRDYEFKYNQLKEQSGKQYKELKENRELAASLQNRISTLSRDNNVNNRNHELYQKNEELNMIKRENKKLKQENLMLIKNSSKKSDMHIHVSTKKSNKKENIDQIMDIDDNTMEEEEEKIPEMSNQYQTTMDNLKDENETLKKENEVIIIKLEEMKKMECEKFELESKNSDLNIALEEASKEFLRSKRIEEENKNLKKENDNVTMMIQELKRTKLELEKTIEELNSTQMELGKVKEENIGLKDHLTHVSSQLDRAKDVIFAKQGILENERNLTAEENKRAEAANKVLVDIQNELYQKQKELMDLSEKDRKAGDVILTLQAKIQEIKQQITQKENENISLKKNLEFSHTEILKIQEEIKSKEDIINRKSNQIANLNLKFSNVLETQNAPDLSNSRYELEEIKRAFEDKIRNIEIELVNERKSHDCTKQQLKNEISRFEEIAKALKDDSIKQNSISLNDRNSFYHTINEENLENSNASTPSITQITLNPEIRKFTPENESLNTNVDVNVDDINQMKENLNDNDEMEIDVFNEVEKPVFLTPMPNKTRSFNLFRNIFTDYKSKDTIQN